MESNKQLVRRAQRGDELAVVAFFNNLRAYHLPRVLRRWRWRNVLVTEDDIESAFMVGAWKALNHAKIDVGDPLEYVVWKADKEVASMFRSRLNREIRYDCGQCSRSGAARFKNKAPCCASCGSQDVWLYQVVNDYRNGELTQYDTTDAPILSSEHVWQVAVLGLEIEEFRARLSGRVLELFDIIVIEGITHDSSKSYLREIADRWGTSPQSVCWHLRKLRAAAEDYFFE